MQKITHLNSGLYGLRQSKYWMLIHIIEYGQNKRNLSFYSLIGYLRVFSRYGQNLQVLTCISTGCPKINFTFLKFCSI